jgi:hypothetical protein
VKRGGLVSGAGIVSRAIAMLKFRRDLHLTRSCASLGGRDLCSPVGAIALELPNDDAP